MGQLRWRFDRVPISDHVYTREQVQVGWRVRCVAHEMSEFIGIEGVVRVTGHIVELDDQMALASSSQRWVRLQ